MIMANGYEKPEIYKDVRELTDLRKNFDDKSRVFVPINGLSQSAKDRLMNKRKLKPPRNLHLIEGDNDAGISKMESSTSKRDLSFPDENLLSATIKEVNGMDYSNYAIEQHYRYSNFESDSSKTSEDLNLLSTTNESSECSESQREVCNSSASNLIEDESLDTKSDSSTDINHPESSKDNSNSHNIDAETMNDMICKFSKNAAIVGLLRNNMISTKDLSLESDEKNKNYNFDNNYQNKQFSSNNKKKKDIIQDDNGDNNSKDLARQTNKLENYPQLVPHPEDSDVYTHPLQAHGTIDDNGIDFTLPSHRRKQIVTPFQYFIQATLDDDIFKFPTNNKEEASKPKSNISLPSMTASARTTRPHNANQFDSLTNNTDDKFVLKHSEFPNLKR